jgi:hypothetical protein
MNRVSAFLLLACSVVCLAQAPQRTMGATVYSDGTKGTKITFHVTSVRHEDDPAFCDTGECSATNLTVEGYTDGMQADTRVVFVLTCDELVAYKPTPHITASCGSVHANNDYDAWMFGSSIAFWPPEKYTPPPLRVHFYIVSEKEVSKPSK